MTSHSFAPSRKKILAVLIPDRLSELAAKGEFVTRYYNPDNFFDEVHLIMSPDDSVDISAACTLAGSARLHIHSLQAGRLPSLLTMLPHRGLLWPWVRRGLELLRHIKPDLIRVHYGLFEGYLASWAKKTLGIPYVVSIHTVWDRDQLYFNTVLDSIYKYSISRLHRTTLKDADAVICVYKEIVRFADAFGSRNSILLYNPVSRSIREKSTYKIADHPRILTVNRLIPGKNPENIIKAVRGLDCHYDIVGQGPLLESLQNLVRSLGLKSRVTFIPSISNASLVEQLPNYDIAVFHCDYRGVSKGILEASLAGVPIVANRHLEAPLPDYEGGWVIQCENTEAGYRQALGALLADPDKRRDQGRAARLHALAHWEPTEMEGSVAAIYAQILGHIA